MRMKLFSSGGERKFTLKGVTAFLFVTTQIAALFWVTLSYIIAIYATVRLGQPFPVTDLSGQAIETILGMGIIKVIGNIFEHNESVVFGKTRKNDDADAD